MRRHRLSGVLTVVAAMVVTGASARTGVDHSRAEAKAGPGSGTVLAGAASRSVLPLVEGGYDYLSEGFPDRHDQRYHHHDRRVDFVVSDDEGQELLVETKARSEILPEDVEQCLLYMHQGGYRLCLLISFGQKPLGIRRFVHSPQGNG